MRRYPSLVIASVFAIAGIFLNAAVRATAATHPQFETRLASCLLGQLCWGVSLMICLIRGNIYAAENISEDGYGMIVFNIVKWGSVVLFLIADSFVLERAYEGYFIFQPWNL